MIKKLTFLFFLILAIHGVAVNNAYSLLIWDWDFDPLSLTVGQTDDIIINTIFSNDATSDQDFNVSDIASRSFNPGNLPSGFYSQDILGFGAFTGFPLAPGDSTNVPFGQFTNLGNPTPVGNYYIQFTINLENGDSKAKQLPINVAGVPEPSSILLLGIGLAGLVAFRKKVS